MSRLIQVLPQRSGSPASVEALELRGYAAMLLLLRSVGPHDSSIITFRLWLSSIDDGGDLVRVDFDSKAVLLAGSGWIKLGKRSSTTQKQSVAISCSKGTGIERSTANS